MNATDLTIISKDNHFSVIKLDKIAFGLQILDDIFASEMQKLRGKSLQEKDLEPPGSVREIHSMLCKDASC